MHEGKKQQKRVSGLRLAVILIAATALAAAAWFSCSYYLELHQARVVLYRAKTVRLAAWSASMDCYGRSEPFSDPSETDGFAQGVGGKISELSGCQGQVRLLRPAQGGYGIAELSYTENGLTALYVSEGGHESWRVLKQAVLLAS